MHHNRTSSSGDCALGLAPASSADEREGALTDGSADCGENTQCAPSACVAHTECGWKGDDSLGSAVVNLDADRPSHGRPTHSL